MQRIHRKVILWLMALTSLITVSCKDKNTPVYLGTEGTPLEVRSSLDSVISLQRQADQTLWQITWTSGDNHGTGSAISYTLEIDTLDETFTHAKVLSIGKTSARTIVFTHRSLADTMRVWFPGISEEKFVPLYIRAKATLLSNNEEQVSPTICVPVNIYRPRTISLYMVGDATPNGWDSQKATAMVAANEQWTRFAWEGLLRKGEYKFLVTAGSWYPCYVRDTMDSNKMVYRKVETDYPDFKWQIDKTGQYKVVADVENLTLEVTSLGGEAYSHLYMIGDATPGGWDWGKVTELVHAGTDLFTWEGTLAKGEIKFPTEIQPDWSGEMLYAPQANCEPSANGTYDAHRGAPDNKWFIPSSGIWSIRIDIASNTISIVKQ